MDDVIKDLPREEDDKSGSGSGGEDDRSDESLADEDDSSKDRPLEEEDVLVLGMKIPLPRNMTLANFLKSSATKKLLSTSQVWQFPPHWTSRLSARFVGLYWIIREAL